MGIFNSACFSINPITSEYLQRYLPEQAYDDTLRQQLGAYKLTNVDFFAGLVDFARSYWSEFAAVADRYDHVMRWEDIIERPVQTIIELGAACDVTVTQRWAEQIWAEMGHRNLTVHHKHNYRQGAGKVGGWKRWLTNQHLEMIAASGIMEPLSRYGYEIEWLDAAEYTPFQARVAQALERGEVLDEIADRDLFGFAFNKSNLDASKFGFRSHPWRTHTRLERSAFGDEAMELHVWDAVERAMERMNAVFAAIAEIDFHRRPTAVRGLEMLLRTLPPTLPPPYDERLRQALQRGSQRVETYFEPTRLDLEPVER